MAQFFPEPDILVEIPFDAVKTLYALKLLLVNSKDPERTQKMIDRAKQRCLDHVTRQHPETSNILDDIKILKKVIEVAKTKQKETELPASSFAETTKETLVESRKKEADRMATEKVAKKETQN
uniref:Uncharacterized protein n=1 Tax=Panagrolaimus sp. ES5 TaxID=591445 RepID=A0AC34G5M9_9BILA